MKIDNHGWGITNNQFTENLDNELNKALLKVEKLKNELFKVEKLKNELSNYKEKLKKELSNYKEKLNEKFEKITVNENEYCVLKGYSKQIIPEKLKNKFIKISKNETIEKFENKDEILVIKVSKNTEVKFSSNLNIIMLDEKSTLHGLTEKELNKYSLRRLSRKIKYLGEK